MALVLNSANVVGYTKCSKQASGQLRDMARNAMTSGLTVRRPCGVLHVLQLSTAVCMSLCVHGQHAQLWATCATGCNVKGLMKFHIPRYSGSHVSGQKLSRSLISASSSYEVVACNGKLYASQYLYLLVQHSSSHLVFRAMPKPKVTVACRT